MGSGSTGGRVGVGVSCLLGVTCSECLVKEPRGCQRDERKLRRLGARARAEEGKKGGLLSDIWGKRGATYGEKGSLVPP